MAGISKLDSDIRSNKNVTSLTKKQTKRIRVSEFPIIVKRFETTSRTLQFSLSINQIDNFSSKQKLIPKVGTILS